MRALILVLDSVGIGAAPDAARYGDEGADTIGHIAELCFAGRADEPRREGPLQLPNLVALGLGQACRLATGRVPAGLDGSAEQSRFGCASEISKGKDTPSGHWEIAGVGAPVRTGSIAGILGNCHASGTEIIAEFGGRHIRTGEPICYTSADSVFQIAAHEETFGLGHRRDVAGFAAALEAFDARVPELLNRLRDDDLLIITADHGCDPTWSGTDHTREQMPILAWSARSIPPIGRRAGCADIGATAAKHLELPAPRRGLHF